MVPLTFLRKKAAHSVPLLLAALIFTGCGTQAPDQSTAHMQGSAQADSGFYLQQMSQSTNDTRINWQLLAIRALLKEGKTQQAAELFSQLPQDLNDTQRHEQTLLSAELKVAQKDYDGAKKILGTIDLSTLDKNQQARFWQAGITAEQGRPSLTLLRALIAQEPLLAGADKQKNIDATWQALASMTQDQAKALVINADENVLQGWLDLQQMWFNNRSDPNMLKAGITDWQKRYPQNPGAKMLPTQLVNVQNFKPASTSKIALLLPLNGQAAVFGRAIQQGFEAAKNGTTAVSGSAVPAQAAQAANVNDVVSPSAAETSDLTTAQTPAQGTMQNPVTAPTTQPATPAPAATQAPAETPAPATAEQPQPQTAQPEQQPATQPQAVATTSANPGAELKIYDTSAQPLDQVLAQVQQDGAIIVVGPLLKNNVEALMKSSGESYGGYGLDFWCEKAAEEIGVGVPTLRDIVSELLKPGRDVRDELPKPILRTDVLEMKDLKPGMILTGTVRNVIDFGVFVDIGVHQDGLVHISQVCDKFIRHPSEAVSVGDVVKVVVLEVDEKKKRISLSMKQAK